MTTEISRLKIGDRVYLTSNIYTPSMKNPTKGSPYECKGTIRKITLYISKIPINCAVEWDNGNINGYTLKRDLTLVNSFHNNYKSIW